jgi:hypothetical protein
MSCSLPAAAGTAIVECSTPRAHGASLVACASTTAHTTATNKLQQRYQQAPMESAGPTQNAHAHNVSPPPCHLLQHRLDTACALGQKAWHTALTSTAAAQDLCWVQPKLRAQPSEMAVTAAAQALCCVQSKMTARPSTAAQALCCVQSKQTAQPSTAAAQVSCRVQLAAVMHTPSPCLIRDGLAPFSKEPLSPLQGAQMNHTAHRTEHNTPVRHMDSRYAATVSATCAAGHAAMLACPQPQPMHQQNPSRTEATHQQQQNACTESRRRTQQPGTQSSPTNTCGISP